MPVLPNKPVKLSIFSSPAFLPVVRAAVEKMCEVVGFDAQGVGNVMLSADEALTNIIRHAYKGADNQLIDIELLALRECDQDWLRIQIRDYGPEVDLSQIKSRDLADVRPGGLGVHIMSKCMDRLEYKHADGGGTLLTMCKRVPAPKE